jgi:hypothetical protein
MNSAQHFKTIGTRNRRFPHVQFPQKKQKKLSVPLKLIKLKLALIHAQKKNLIYFTAT